MPVCDNCQRLFTHRPRIVVPRHRCGSITRRFINPIDIAAMEAIDRGIVYHLLDREELFAYDTLKSKLETYPDLFMKVRSDWLVRPDLVIDCFKKGKGHFLKVEGVDREIPVAQKNMEEVRRDFGRNVKKNGHSIVGRSECVDCVFDASRVDCQNLALANKNEREGSASCH
jgi:hypothetical protein